MGAHSPGPWSDKGRMNGGISIIFGDNPFNIVCANIGGASLAQVRANARLISAAPDLLSACKRVMELAASAGSDEIFAEVRSAIAKAEGRT